MSESAPFSYERFTSLSSTALAAYAEPFVNTQTHTIPESVYHLLARNIATLDEEHTVYALEMCMALKPCQAVYLAVERLAHTDAAVCCAAFRVLERVPPESMPPDLTLKIAATPKVDLFATDVQSGKRIRVGTNAKYLRDLVARFSVPQPPAVAP